MALDAYLLFPHESHAAAAGDSSFSNWSGCFTSQTTVPPILMNCSSSALPSTTEE